MNRLLLACAFAAFTQAALAQTVVAKALVDGKEVVLFSDQTWRYSAAIAPDCNIINAKLTFCGAAAQWKPSPPPAPTIAAAYQFNGTTYGQFVIEDVGTDLGLTHEKARALILQGIKVTTNEDPTVITVEPMDFQGQPTETIVYLVKTGGLDVIFSNTIFLGKATLAQIMTYEIASAYTETHKAAHAAFTTATQVTETN